MDDTGFKKIDVANSSGHYENVSKNAVSGRDRRVDMKNGRKKRFYKSRPYQILGAVLIVLVLVVVFIAVRMLAIYKDAKVAEAQAKVAYAAVKQQDVVAAHDQLVTTQQKLDIVKKDLDGSAYIGYIPLLGAYYQDAQHLVNASTDGAQAGIVATEAIIPYADVLGLKGKGSFVMGSAEDRIRLAVKTLGKVVPKIDDIESQVKLAQSEVDKIDINRYPNFWMFKKVRDQIFAVKSVTDEASVAVAQGKPLIKVLPDLLGESAEQKYLILFQNDKELRPTGGFITFYSIFRVAEGVINVDSSGDIYDLDASIPYHPAAPSILAKYLNVSTWNIRDSNMSPDFITSMGTFNMFYNKSSIKQNVNGIIAIDTDVLVDTLNILGDVTVDGVTYNTQNDARCSCPQVVYQLEASADQPVGYVRTNRKSAVGDLLFAILQKALKSSPKQYWGPLFQVGIKDINEKHILFAMNDSSAQAGMDSLNWSGRIQGFQGDYLHINDANLGGEKSNMYVTSAVKVEYQNNNGEITKTLTLTYKNPYAYSDCNPEHGALCLNATLRNFQRVYVPKGSTLISTKGSEVKVTTNEDLGKTDFEAFFRVNPKGFSTITYTYKLPFKVSGSTLPVMIQKQPGTNAIPYDIWVNGHEVETINLDTDKTINLNI